MIMKIRTASLSATLALAATLNAQPLILLPPVINSPGNLTQPGPTLATSFPAFAWNQIPTVNSYGLYISNLTDHVLVYPNLSGIPAPLTNGSPFVLPQGYLIGGKAYSWAMTSISGSIESTQSLSRYFQTPPSPMPQPPVTAATGVSVSGFVANWAPIPGALGYVVDVSSSSTFSSFINTGRNLDVGNSLFATIVGLNSGTTYYYRVRAYNLSTVSGNSLAVSATTLPYSLPSPNATAATLVATNSFLANWNGVPTALGYRIDISTNINFTTFISGGQDMNVGPFAFAFLTNLMPNTTYYYRVRSYDNTATSPPSKTIAVTTVPTILSPPVAAAATSITASGFTANWSGVTGANGYRLDVATDTTFTAYVAGYQNLDAGNVLNQAVVGLNASTTYYYRVRAYGALGTSTNSGTISVTTSAPAPPAPVANAATSIAATSFIANWSPAISSTSYNLDVSTGSNFTSFVTGYQNLNVGNALSKTVTGLAASTTYYYRVRAANGGGASTNSATISLTTLPAPPPAPAATAATGVTSSNFTANWKAANSATGYRLDVSTSSSFATFVAGYQNLDVGNVTNQNVAGLNGNTIYYYRLRAYNGLGTSANSTRISVTTLRTPPGPPVATAATSVTATSFSANWTKVSGATSYQLDISTNSSFGNFISGYQNLNVGNVATKAVGSLHAGNTYYYRLRASNTGGASVNSAIITVVTIPPAPTVVAGTSITSSNFTANWNSANGAAGYRFDLSTNSTFTSFVTGWHNLDVGNTTSESVTGLIANKTYYYRVRAYNVSGTSGNSSTEHVKTLPTPPPPAPALVITLEANNLVLSWPTNDPAYKLFYATNIPPTAWISNAIPPSIVAGQYTVTNTVGSDTKIFRLKK